jgi:hypothetical protein
VDVPLFDHRLLLLHKEFMSRVANLAPVLAARQCSSGGWSYFHSAQTSLEATALAILALGPKMPRIAERAIDHLRNLQHPDGGWPAFSGDSESRAQSNLWEFAG